MQQSFSLLDVVDPSNDPTAPNKLQLFPEFITPEEERVLLAEIEKLNWQDVKMHGVVAKRKVKHYGMDYTFDRRSVKPTEPPPAFLELILKRVASIMNLREDQLQEVLVTYYPEGAGIGWHRDAPPFGDAVAGISLLSPCTMKFRRKVDSGYEIFKLSLEPRSAYIFSGEARWNWEHTIASHKAPRYSITFRTLRESKR